MKKPAAVFCDVPFREIHTNVTGDVRVCCYVERSIGNFHQNKLEDIWRSESAIEIRESIYDQSFRFCDKTFCSIAARARTKALEDDAVKDELKSLRDEFGLVPSLERVAVQHDDSCNLSCPSCRSDLIYASKKRQAQIMEIQDEWLAGPVLSKAKLLTVSGNGDPFASNVYMDMLRKISAERYPDLHVHFLTNGLLLTRKRWEELSNLHYAAHTISVSIDAAKADTYATVRRGGSFSKLVENLEFVSELRRAGKIESFVIKFVVSATNFREMPDFVRLGKRLGCDMVKFQLIVQFAHLSKQDYDELAIHQPQNRHYADFVDVLKDPIFDDPIVHMMNFHAFGDAPVIPEDNRVLVQQPAKPLPRWSDDPVLALKWRVARALPAALADPMRKIYRVGTGRSADLHG